MNWRSIFVLTFVVFGLFSALSFFPQKAFAETSSSDLQGILNRCSSNFGDPDVDRDLNSACRDLVNAKFSSLGQDVDVSANQLEVYALEDYLALLRFAKGETSSVSTSVRDVIPSLVLNRLRSAADKTYGAVGVSSADRIQGYTKYFREIQAVNQRIDGARNRDLAGSGVITPEEQERRRLESARNTGQAINDSIVQESVKKCEGTSPATWFTVCLDEGLAWLVKNTLLRIAGWFLWLSSQLLDYIVNIGIVNFKNWAPDDLYPIWKLVRQIISMFVVFSGLYIGFMYIIGQKSAFQRYFVWIAIFGIFVNFSYPLTRVAIDLSNIVSVSIYASALGTTPDKLQNASAGTLIVTKLGLGSLVGQATSQASNTSSAGVNVDVYKDINSTPGALLVVGYVVYAAYIFFFAAGLLMLRTLALSFIIISSPLMLVDSVIPKLGSFAQKLREIFFQQLSLSVVFMVMLYLAIKMINVFGAKGTLGQTSGGLSSVSGVAQIFNVIMMLVVLHIMLKVTKATAGALGEMASNYIGKVGGFATGAAVGVATGGAGLLARGTIGAAAARWAESDTLRNAQGSWMGRRAMDLSTNLANSSFDLRKSDKFASVAGTMGGAGMTKGLGITGRLKTYNDALKDKKDDVERRAGMMTDEAARNKYIQDQKSGLLQSAQGAALYGLGVRGANLKTDGELAASGVLKKTKEQEAELFKKYASSSDDVREAMRLSQTSEIYAQKFAAIDKILNPLTPNNERSSLLSRESPELQKLLRDQAFVAANKADAKNREEQLDVVKNFFTSSKEAVAVLKENGTETQKKMLAIMESYQNMTPQEKASLLAKNVNTGEISNAVAKSIISADNGEDRKEKEALLALFNQQTKKEKPTLSKEETDALQSITADLAEFVKKGNQNPPSGTDGSPVLGGGPKQTPPSSGEVVQQTKQTETV